MVDPERVLSPKSRLRGPIKVIKRDKFKEEGSEEELHYSIAQFVWDSREVTGIRWDGDPDRPDDVGNPQSRGLPTWFVLPKPVAAVLLKHGRLEGSMPAAQNAGQLSLDELDERMEQIAERVATRILEQHS